jgi:hypothetical protein
VHILAYVPDNEPFLNNCRVSVAPLRFGAGVKGKINQSLAYELPVVGTMIAVEGMFLKYGEFGVDRGRCALVCGCRREAFPGRGALEQAVDRRLSCHGGALQLRGSATSCSAIARFLTLVAIVHTGFTASSSVRCPVSSPLFEVNPTD